METMAELARFALFVLGWTYIFTRSSIFRGGRLLLCAFLKSDTLAGWLTALIYCPACSGFWIGLLHYRQWPWPTDVPLAAALCGCALGSFAAGLWHEMDHELETLREIRTHGSQKEEG